MYEEHHHTWRKLMHHDWSFEWFGQLCCIESTHYVTFEHYIDFQLPSKIRSASRTPSYLEDISGSLLELWMIWFNLLCWIILRHPQEASLKDSWRSNLIWLRHLRSKNVYLCVCLFVCFCFNYCGTPTGSFSECFVRIQLDLTEIFRTLNMFICLFCLFIDLFVFLV